MKFKLIFILFNLLIVSSFLMLFLMPVFMIGWDFAGTLWSESWYLPVIFVIFIAILNVYFLYNWRLFTLLEQERWQELIDYLYDEFFHKSKGRRGLRLNSPRIRIFINGCMVNSRMENISELADFLREKQPSLFGRYFLLLGMPVLLKENPAELENFYGNVFSIRNVKDKTWCIWIYSFALVLQKKQEAAGHLENLILEKDPVIKLLSLYLYEILTIRDGVSVDKFEKEKNELRTTLTPYSLTRIRQKQEGNLLFFAVSKLIDQAFDWLRDGKKAQEPVSPQE